MASSRVYFARRIVPSSLIGVKPGKRQVDLGKRRVERSGALEGLDRQVGAALPGVLRAKHLTEPGRLRIDCVKPLVR